MLEMLRVAEAERETVRVFAVALDPPRAKEWAKVHRNLETALGVPLDPDHLEHFPSEDLKGLGLTQFLIDGYGIDEPQIAADRDALDEAEPYVLLLRARAFKGAGVTLKPQPPLVALGVYGQAPAAASKPTAQRQIEPANLGATPPGPNTPPKGSLIAILIFLGLALILFAVLILPKL
ncbi:MAG: hypothetical protein AAGP08_05980 [Pseudomonadota bacterium]